MRIVFENHRFQAEVDTLGAELRRLRDCVKGEELLWQGDPAVWSGSAPVLFPVVGRLREGGYRHKGQRYEMPKHGFARSSEFAVTRQEGDVLTLELRESPQTLQIYPFAFSLQITFRLLAAGLRVEYAVRNPAATELFFTLGSHPGLCLPPEGGPYRIEFDEPETLAVFRLEGDLLSTQSEPFMRGERIIPLTPDTFARDALIFKNISSRRIGVVGQQRAVYVDTSGAPHLGLWAKAGAEYVCIEPWYSYDDAADVSGELSEKPGILTLAPYARFTTAYTIELPA